MGYSARYHAASLAAIFLALAVGILVGAEFGGEVLSDTRRSLERSLMDNLEDSRSEVEGLSAELGRSEEFGQRVYPALVGDRLFGSRVGIVAFGGLSPGVVGDIEAAIEPTGGEIAGIGVVREPPRPEALARALVGTRFAGLDDDPELIEELGEVLGGQFVSGGNLLERVRGEVFSRVSGGFGDIDRMIVLRAEPGTMDPGQEEATTKLTDGLMRGFNGSAATTVGVERSDADPSSVAFFDSHSLASVDNIDTVAGKLALILALRGAKGSFGIKESADSLLPDLITGSDAAVGTTGAASAEGAGQDRREQ